MFWACQGFLFHFHHSEFYLISLVLAPFWVVSIYDVSPGTLLPHLIHHGFLRVDPLPSPQKSFLCIHFFWRNLEKEIKIFDFSCMHAVLSRTIFFSIIKDGNFIRCYPDGWKEENVGAHVCILTSRGISFLEELFLWQFNNSAESVPNAYECSSTNGEAPKFRMEFLIVPGWEYWLRDSSGKSKTINSSFPPKKTLRINYRHACL